MAAYLLDASGLVKRHVSEAGTSWVRSLTRPEAGHTIFLARVTGIEVSAAIARRQRGGSLTAAEAGAILGRFRRQFTRYHVLELTPPLLADAMLLIMKHGLRAYDAVPLATLREVDRLYRAAGMGPVTLISADRKLNAAATAEGLVAGDPTTHP